MLQGNTEKSIGSCGSGETYGADTSLDSGEVEEESEVDIMQIRTLGDLFAFII